MCDMFFVHKWLLHIVFWKWQTLPFDILPMSSSFKAKLLGGFLECMKRRLRWPWMWKRSQHCKASPKGKVWRVITLAFITSCMVGCILYCSGTGRPIHLHWFSYSRWLYGSWGRSISMKCQADLIGLPFTVFEKLCCYSSFSLEFGSSGCTVESFVKWFLHKRKNIPAMQWCHVFLPEFLVENLTVGFDILKMFSCDIWENIASLMDW